MYQLCTYTYVPSLLETPSTLILPIWIITEHWAEPVLRSSLPLVIYFTHGSVYMSPDLPIHPMPTSPTVSTHPFSVSALSQGTRGIKDPLLLEFKLILHKTRAYDQILYRFLWIKGFLNCIFIWNSDPVQISSKLYLIQNTAEFLFSSYFLNTIGLIYVY